MGHCGDPCQTWRGTLQLHRGPGGGCGVPEVLQGSPGTLFSFGRVPSSFYRGSPRGKRVGIPQFLHGSPALAGFLQFLQVSPHGKRVGIPQVLRGSPALAGFPPIFHRGPRGRLLKLWRGSSNVEKVFVGEACGGPLDVCSKVLSHTARAQGGFCACVICPCSSQ